MMCDKCGSNAHTAASCRIGEYVYGPGALGKASTFKEKYGDKITVGQCEGCDFEDVEVIDFETHFETAAPLDTKNFQLCQICFSTDISNSAFYPSQYPERRTLRAIGYVANLLLRELKR